MELKNQVTIITGGGQGIGKTIACSMAREGSRIMIADINLETARSTTKELVDFGYEAQFVIGDVHIKKDVENMFKTVMDKFGRLDILVNNAGYPKVGPIEEISEEEWDNCMDVNIKGMFLCSQAAVKIMKKQKKGCIITISSIHGLIGMPERGPYSASKAGIINLTRTLAAELGKDNIRVNSVAPGYTATEGLEKLAASKIFDKEKVVECTPLHELVNPDDIANAVIFLASKKARSITGVVLPVDGGWLSDGSKGMKRPSDL